MMLNSGSSVSLLWRDSLNKMDGTHQLPNAPALRLVTAAGAALPIAAYVQAPVKIVVKVQQFLVVDNLITLAILGLDFMKKHGITMDFTTYALEITLHGTLPMKSQECGRPGVRKGAFSPQAHPFVNHRIMLLSTSEMKL